MNNNKSGTGKGDIMRIVKLTQETKTSLLKDLLKRSPDDYGTYEDTVKEIVANVHKNGDAALFSYTEKFDHAHVDASNVKVTDAEIEEAYKEVSPELLAVIR